MLFENDIKHIDLQMAATFGKMLLEKNEKLEQELRNLQKVAEETTLENQVRCLPDIHVFMLITYFTCSASPNSCHH